jgi:hypothetical protein
MSIQKIIGKEIFKYGNLTVHQTDCGTFIISNGDVLVTREQMPQLEVKPLLNLLIAKDTLTDCFMIGRAEITSSSNKAKFNHQFQLFNANYQAQLEGYAIGY